MYLMVLMEVVISPSQRLHLFYILQIALLESVNGEDLYCQLYFFKSPCYNK